MGVSFGGDQTLRVPGPTPVPAKIAQAASQPMLWHRSPEFLDVFSRVQRGLQRLFHTSSDVITIAGSGTAGMESAVANLLAPGEQAVVVSGGKFGERWVEIVTAFGGRPAVLSHPYGSTAPVDELADFLRAHPDARVVFATQNESSTAVLNDIQAIAQVTKEADRLLVVDAISSLGGTPMPMDAWGVDVVITGSQKCLMLPPGLAFVGISPRAWEKAKGSQGPSYYLNWEAYKDAAEALQSPYTSAVTLVVQLDEALRMLYTEGDEARFQRHRLMQQMVRASMRALGFDLYADDAWASPTLTSVRGGSVDVDALLKAVRAQTGVVLAGGQGEMKGEIFRIGHMGAATPLDMVTTVGAVELALVSLGHDTTLGHGTGRALEVWHRWR